MWTPVWPSLLMANRFQLAFLASTVASFFALFFLSRLVLRLLTDAGYDPSHLILLGLPINPDPVSRAPPMGHFNVPFLGEVDLIGALTNAPFLASAFLIGGTLFLLTRSTQRKALDPTKWQEFPLKEKIQISPNTAIYRFKLPGMLDVLGLPIGQHVSVSADINGKLVARSYTPVSSDNDPGCFDLLIKSYEKGNISRIMSTLKIGDTMRFKGPKGNFIYTPGLCKHISMIAGGTGITPMLQIIRAVLGNPGDPTEISLIYANVNYEDILLKEDLDQLSKLHSNRFKVFFVLNNPPTEWQGGVGFVTKEHIKEHLRNPDQEDGKLLICGPPPMVAAMKKNIQELGFPAPNTISKLQDKVFVF